MELRQAEEAHVDCLDVPSSFLNQQIFLKQNITKSLFSYNLTLCEWVLWLEFFVSPTPNSYVET